MRKDSKFTVSISGDIIREVIEHLLAEYMPDGYNVGKFRLRSFRKSTTKGDLFLADVLCRSDHGFDPSLSEPTVSFESRKDRPNEENFKRSKEIQKAIIKAEVEGTISGRHDDRECKNRRKPRKKTI